MTCPATFSTAPAFRLQSGATLVIALILLMIMSVLAATSLRGTLMQERMSSNTHDRDLAFQSAEAGLRMGERQAENCVINGATPAWSNCNSPNPGTGLYRNIDAQCPQPLWEGPAPGENNAFWHDGRADTGENDILFADSGLSLAPYYIVELISENAPCQLNDPDVNQNCKRFRVTAISQTAGGRSRVLLQSIYATE